MQFEKYIWSLFSENDFLKWVTDKEYIKVISFFKCLECPGSLEHRLYDLTMWQYREKLIDTDVWERRVFKLRNKVTPPGGDQGKTTEPRRRGTENRECSRPGQAGH